MISTFLSLIGNSDSVISHTLIHIFRYHPMEDKLFFDLFWFEHRLCLQYPLS